MLKWKVNVFITFVFALVIVWLFTGNRGDTIKCRDKEEILMEISVDACLRFFEGISVLLILGSVIFGTFCIGMIIWATRVIICDIGEIISDNINTKKADDIFKIKD